jgi:hypothetical protein
MQSMKREETLVVGGVDAHADSHHAAALDERGALLATKSFPTTTSGYAELLGWLGAFGAVAVVAVVAVESTGAYAAALVRYLREHDVWQPASRGPRQLQGREPTDQRTGTNTHQGCVSRRSGRAADSASAQYLPGP